MFMRVLQKGELAMAIEAGWRTYAKLNRRQRLSLERKARRGDADALSKFNDYSRSIRATANSRLRELEKAGLDYGPAYNNLMHYLQTEFDGRNRLPTPKQMGNDIEEIRWMNDFAVKFLKSPTSTVKGRALSNQYRVEKLQEYEVLPKTFIEGRTGKEMIADWRYYDAFLRYLGSEEISTGIDGYGESDVVVDMLWDYWNKFDTEHRGSNLILMKQAFARYNAGQKDFAAAMRDVGVKIENYRGHK